MIGAEGPKNSEKQFTDTAGFNIFANWGEISVGHGEGAN